MAIKNNEFHPSRERIGNMVVELLEDKVRISHLSNDVSSVLDLTQAMSLRNLLSEWGNDKRQRDRNRERASLVQDPPPAER